METIKIANIDQYGNTTYEDIEQEEYYMEIPPETQIEQLKQELRGYDYIGVKIAMGVATKEEYADKIEYTETLRKRIRELEGQP